MHNNGASELPKKIRKIIIATEVRPEVVLSDSREDINDESSEFEYCPSSDSSAFLNLSLHQHPF